MSGEALPARRCRCGAVVWPVGAVCVFQDGYHHQDYPCGEPPILPGSSSQAGAASYRPAAAVGRW